MLRLHTDIKEIDKYVQYITESYDLNIERATVIEIPTIPMDELKKISWNIGLVCGGSGTGKTTILAHHFGLPIKPIYDEEKPIISQFEELEPEEVCDVLESVGLSSVPVWLRKPHELSMGEKARLDLCYAIIKSPKDGTIVIDEFTSTINREVAKSLAFALQRYVRQNNLKIVIATCHFDMLNFLQPDWIFNLNKKNNGEAEIEHLNYSDGTYSDYKNVNPNCILSETYQVK